MMPLMRFLVVAVLALVLSACSSSEDDAPEEPQASTSEPAPAPTVDPADELEAAVEAYSAAFLSGDGAAAYNLLSERCRDRTPLSEFAGVVEQASAVYGEQAITSLEVTVNGEQAQATYGYADPTLDQDREPWVNEGGWRNDDC